MMYDNQPAPMPRQMMPNLAFRSLAGQTVRVQDYRMRQNLVLLFLPNLPDDYAWLRELGRRYHELRANEAAALVILPQDAPADAEMVEGLPFAVVRDAEGEAFARVGAAPGERVIYVADRFTEIFAVYRLGAAQPLPSVDDLLEWLEFIEVQCPE